jgi:hypothetical protein
LPSGKVPLFQARVRRPGLLEAAAFEGAAVEKLIDVLPVLDHGRTLAHAHLGSENLLRVSLEETERQAWSVGKTETDQERQARVERVRQHKGHTKALLTDGLSVAGQHYRLLCLKGKFVWFVAVGGRWSTEHAALQSLADFERCGAEKGPVKYASRPQLALSQTYDLLPVLCEALGAPPRVERLRLSGGEWRADLEALEMPPEGTLRIVEVDDDRGTEGGEMTDGMGLISADMARCIPRVGHGQAMQAGDAVEQYGLTSLCQQDGPLVTQMRLWYSNPYTRRSLAKGTLMRDATLAPRSIVLRRSMVKVDGSNCCNDVQPLAFEVNQTSEFARPCRTTSQLIPILEALGGKDAGAHDNAPTPMVRELLQLAEKQRSKIVDATEDVSLLRELSMRGYKEHDHPGDNPAEARMRWSVPIEARALMAGFKASEEPYLRRAIMKLRINRLKKVRLGSFPIPESCSVLGVADPTRTLPEGAAVVIMGGTFRPPGEVLFYRSPGIHCGDVRKGSVVLPSEELKAVLGKLGPRDNAVIFSVQGKRSLADEQAGGDLDGDIFSVIWNASLVAACECQLACSAEELKAVEVAQEEETGGSIGRHGSGFELDERMREKQHAATVLKIRGCQHLVGQAANYWLKLAETVGALDERAKQVACIYCLALDASKTGKAVPKAQRFTGKLPIHLQDHKCHRPGTVYEGIIQWTALARLHALQMPADITFERTEFLLRMVPPDFRPPPDEMRPLEGGPRYAELREFLSWAQQLWSRYKQASQPILNGDAAAKWASFDDLINEFRSELLSGLTLDERFAPALNSPLLAKIAALYFVSYTEASPKSEGTFAWRVVPDYLCYLKVALKAREELAQSGHGGCAPVFDPVTMARMMAPQRTAPISESQEM